jgi:hypothetical protein
MKVHIDVTSLGLVFNCTTCGNRLEQFIGKGGNHLEHPAREEGIFFDGKAIDCPYVGKKFKWPFEKELESLP